MLLSAIGCSGHNPLPSSGVPQMPSLTSSAMTVSARRDSLRFAWGSPVLSVYPPILSATLGYAFRISAMFLSCSGIQASRVALPVSKWSRSNVNHVLSSITLLASSIKAINLFSTPNSGILSSTPDGSFLTKNLPRAEQGVAYFFPCFLGSILHSLRAAATPQPEE